MAKFNCLCGHVIDLIKAPAKEEFKMIPELLLEKLGAGIDKGAVSEDVFFDSIRDHGRSLIECPNCLRLWMSQIIEGEYKYISFVKEEDVINGSYSPPKFDE